MYDKPKISYLESLIVFICSYSFIGSIFSRPGTIEKIIFGVVVSVLYLKLLDLNYISAVLRTITSILWTFLLAALFYTFVSVGAIAAIFAILMFIIFMKLHHLDVINWIKNIVRIISKVIRKKEKIELNGVKTKNPDPKYKELRNAISLFLDTYWKYKSFVEKNGVDRGLYDSATEANTRTVFILQECAGHKFFIDSTTKEWMQSTTGQYMTLVSCMELEMKQYANASSEHSSNSTTNSSSERKETKQGDVDESLFSGCDSAESLKTRYRQLMKMYHPDAQNGNVEMSQKVQKTYQELSARYGK